jgi:hypothetical protein
VKLLHDAARDAATGWFQWLNDQRRAGRARSGQAPGKHLDMAADADMSSDGPIASQATFRAHRTLCVGSATYPLKAVARVRIPSGLPHETLFRPGRMPDPSTIAMII